MVVGKGLDFLAPQEAPAKHGLDWLASNSTPTGWESVQNVASGVAQGVLGTVADVVEAPVIAAEAVGIPAQWTPASKLAQGARLASEATDPNVYQDTPEEQAGRVLGSVGTYLVPGAGAEALIGKGAAMATAGLMGAASGATMGWYDAKAKGADDATAFGSYILNGIVGTTNALPAEAVVGRMAQVMARANTMSGGWLKTALIGGGANALQGATQRTASNVIAQAMYDDDRQILEGAAKDGSLGAFAGFVLGAAGHGLAKAAKLRTSKAATTEASAQETGNPATPPEPTTTIAPEPTSYDSHDVGGDVAPDQTPVKQQPLAQPPVAEQTTPVSETPTSAAVIPSAPPATAAPEAGAGGVSVHGVEGDPWNPKSVTTEGTRDENHYSAVNTALSHSAHFDDATGEIVGIHLTDNPDKAVAAIKSGNVEGGRGDKFGDIGPGLYFSDVPQLWTGRSRDKWSFLESLSREQRERVAESVKAHPNFTDKGYITESERSIALRDLERWVEDPNNSYGITNLSDQPYNIRASDPSFLRPLGIEPGKQPHNVEVRIRGKLVAASAEPGLRSFTPEMIQRLKDRGYVGAFERGGMVGTPQAVVWDASAITKFGDYDITRTTPPVVTPPKPTPLPPGKGDDLTGIKHASTEADREVLGLLEREGRTPKKDADILTRARGALEADPLAGQKIVEARERDGRQLNDEEGMLVALELTRIKNERDAAEEAYIADPSPDAKARIEAARAAYDRTASLAETSGSEQGAAFRMRRALLKRDYSLAAMERTLEVSKGAPLSEQDVADVKALHERLTKAEADLAGLQKSFDEQEAQRQFEGLKREVQGRGRSSVRQQRVAQNKTRMDAILRELADTKAFAGVDPAKLVKVVEFAKLAIENGALKFADFAEQILKAGEHVKPYLEDAWKKAQEERRTEFAAKIKERGDAPAGRYVNEIAKSLVDSGITEREPLIDELHAILKTVDPTITREQARDALSGYGKYREASKEETDVTLRQLKGEMQKVAQIEALEKKAAPLKTGFDRGDPSDEYRRLTKRANELRKQLDIKTVDPERQLQTVLDSDKRRLENQISDLQYEIDHKTRIVRERGEHPTTPEIEALKKQRDELKRQRDEILNPPAPPKVPDTREQKLQREVDRIVRRLAAMDTAKKGKPQGPPTEAEARLLTKLDELRGMLRDVQKPAPPTPAEIEARQVATAMRNVEKSIADYEQRIAAGDIARKEGKPGPTSPELEAMRARREALKATLDEMREAAKPKKPEVDKSEEARLQRRIESVVRRLATLDTEKKAPDQGPPTEAVQRLREELKTLNKRLSDVQKPAPLTPAELQARKDAASSKAYLTRKANDIARLKERAAREDFGPAPKKERILTPPEIAKKAEYEKARMEFERKKLEYEKAHRTKLEKVRDAAKEVFNLPKSIFSSFDVSAVGRQGAVLSGSDALLRPVQLTSRIGRMFRALANEDYALRVDTEIRNHPLYETAKKAGIEFTGHNDALTPREEIFKSQLAEKIPLVGKAVQASERAYSTYLNLLRFDHFRRLVAATDGSPQAAKALANFVNVATGRGNVGKGKFAAAVNASGMVLWAPRLYVSRFQLLFGQPLVGGTARTRALILREYATSLAALASVYTLVGLIGDDDVTISRDPTSSDFGKIKIGNTRIDPLAGLSQTARLVAREGIALSQGAESKENAAEIAFTFLKTKFSPSITVPYELAFEKNFAYGRKSPRPSTVGEAAARMAPLSFQDTLDAMKEQGVSEGVALGILSMFGVGLNTYEKKK